ncbi:hypothetical protein [Kordia sp.]|nr:hypothetical protein [Kordia sp.]MCH2194704.1 hypothetical protein [Kordia sp.]
MNSLQLNKRSISSIKKLKGGRVPVDSDCSSFGNGECEKTCCNCDPQDTH